jgi:hypothetical protein
MYIRNGRMDWRLDCMAIHGSIMENEVFVSAISPLRYMYSPWLDSKMGNMLQLIRA